MTIDISVDEFYDALRREEHAVIVEVWAPWCAPCRAMAPALERVSQAYAGRVGLWKLKADEQTDLVRALGVRSVPTLVVFHLGKEIARRVGAQSPASLDNLFQAASSGEAPARAGMALTDRLLRVTVGGILVVIGGGAGPSLPLLVAGAVVLFSGVHDRCPLWQMILPRLRRRARLGGGSRMDTT